MGSSRARILAAAAVLLNLLVLFALLATGFVLMDKLEQMDLDTLKEFGEWLQKEGLQVIATRVSTGDECSVIIEDGMVESDNSEAPVEEIRQRAPKFVKGVF